MPKGKTQYRVTAIFLRDRGFRLHAGSFSWNLIV